MDDEPPPKGSYARRRTETKRDDVREIIKQNRIDAHEKAAFMETLKACERFNDSRGISETTLTNDFRKVVVTVINTAQKPNEERRFIRKAQDPDPTRSMKAAIIREVVMAARRAGIIKDGYNADQPMPMVEWMDDE